jgi:L-lactate utilization protein LutB
MLFGNERAELKRQNAQLRKENMEMANRIKEARNQIAVMKTSFDAQMDALKSTYTTSLMQMDRVMKETIDRMQKDGTGFIMPQYINEDY